MTGPAAAVVGSILIAPVKGMRVQALAEAEVTAEGVAGDRAFFFVDGGGAMVSATRIGPLLAVVPVVDPVAGRLQFEFPSGSPEGTVAGQVELGEPEQVTFFGLSLEARAVAGPFSEAISRHCGIELRLMARPENRPAVDRGWAGAVTLLGSGSIKRLEKAAAGQGEQGPIDPRRFRMTFTLDGLAPHQEDGWIGRTVRVGGAEVLIAELVGRCAATTRDPDRGEVDLKTLRYLASYRRDVPSTEELPFGVYASVTRPGTVRLGDLVAPVPDTERPPAPGTPN